MARREAEMSDPNKTVRSVSDIWAGGTGRERLPVLIVLRGAQIGRRYLLNERALVLGRVSGKARITIPGDPEISGVHCRIELDPIRDQHVVTDLGSTNGTRVNGTVVASPTEINDGDKILIGQTILKFSYHDVVEGEFHQELDRMMNIDDLTGLVVLRVFEERFRHALA